MQGGMTAMSLEGALDVWLRNDNEWLRWEEIDKWDWNPTNRKLAAERIFRDHKVRRCASLQCSVYLSSQLLSVSMWVDIVL